MSHHKRALSELVRIKLHPREALDVQDPGGPPPVSVIPKLRESALNRCEQERYQGQHT